MLKPWREIAVPHRDVLEGTLQQSEFAADLMAVHEGRASATYLDPRAFFQRTFITEGMRLLLTSVAQRLNGQGGDPVLQLQTAFGGGKTHTLLAVYHLAKGGYATQDLPGVAPLLDQAGLAGLPVARVAVLDGNHLAPGQTRARNGQTVRTLWGELAWQLGKEEGYALVAEADANGTSPGKEVLQPLLAKYAPCVLLVDELVAYVRQFEGGKSLPGGTYDSNMSFIQALTESVKQVPNAILLASLPESEVEAGSQTGVAALKALEKVFGRVQALWKPVATEEAFEIVRRRLFEPVTNPAAQEAVCRAFAEAYKQEGAKLPTKTQEAHYHDRLMQAYPIHPEVFDRLYEDWSGIDGFQRTRGVLKLMAKVIQRLWKSENQDLMILPGSLPLDDSSVRNELVYYLPTGWDPVLERDIDGDRAATSELEAKETRFGAVQAARRVARTLFLGTAPASASTKKPVTDGLDRAHVLLGCIQPGQAFTLYSDALNRLVDVTHHLHTSGDKTLDSTRFWFNTRAGLRREMEDRKRRFHEAQDLRPRLTQVVRKMAGSQVIFPGVHVFTPHGDVPDDSTLRLVVLGTDKFYSRHESRFAFEEVLEFLRTNGTRPRHKANRLMFLAADHDALHRLSDALRTALAWKSIVDDAEQHRLNLDLLQAQQAKKDLDTAEAVLPRVVRECFRWLLCPVQHTPTGKIEIEAFQLNTSGASLDTELERVCRENELVLKQWAPTHLQKELKRLYWKADRPAVPVATFWEDSQKYLYLPRFQDRGVLDSAVQAGARSRDFFGIAYGESVGKFEGFQFGAGAVQVDDALLLIEPEAAKAFEATQVGPKVEPPVGPDGLLTPPPPIPGRGLLPPVPEPPDLGDIDSTPKVFFGSVDVKASTARARLMEMADEVIAVLGHDPQATVKVTLNIEADFPAGVSDQIKRAVAENTKALGFKAATWE
jgi:predicted AAA+ superfamily ATPase